MRSTAWQLSEVILHTKLRSVWLLKLLALMDGFESDANVVVIAATNRPQDLDIALRRPGRFDWEIEFPYPDERDRADILAKTAGRHTTQGTLPHSRIAAMTAGWSGADLAAIWSEAALLAVQDKRCAIYDEDYIGGFAQRISRNRNQTWSEPHERRWCVRLPSRLLRRVRQLKNRRKRPEPDGQLREFVYLDEVSVYSILASRRGGIATEFTESQTASLNSGVGASLGVSGTTLNAKTHATQTQGSQVLRKAIIQTSFKELYDIERDGLALRPRHGCRVPRLSCVADLEGQLDSLSRDGWIVDPRTIHRGELLELLVELEAEPIFQLVTVSSTLRELIEESPQVFDKDITDQFAETQAVARVLGGMLVGLVPIRGRLVDYECMHIGERDVLVHRSVLDQIPPDAQAEICPVFVVGVAQRDLFWKDIRRVLFSGAP